MARKRRRRRNPGDIHKVRAVMWEAIEMLEHYLLEPHDASEDLEVNELCKLVHALSQASNTYKGLIEVGELEERLAAIEAAQTSHAA